MKKLKIIYEPKGRAQEYSPLALNIYNGCTHGCSYCFNQQYKKEAYFEGPDIKKDIEERVFDDAMVLAEAEDDREILLSFMGDVYQPEERHYKMTCSVINILMSFNLRFTILTKGGLLATRDFHLYSDYEKASFGVSMMCVDDDIRKQREPNAAPIKDRIKSLEIAKNMGIKTWLSLEPVIHPSQGIQVLSSTIHTVDKYKIGKINHNPELERWPDWIAFREHVKAYLDHFKIEYYIKKSLSELEGK